MNGTDWPSPDANLSNVEQQIKKIVAATGVDVPRIASGPFGKAFSQIIEREFFCLYYAFLKPMNTITSVSYTLASSSINQNFFIVNHQCSN